MPSLLKKLLKHALTFFVGLLFLALSFLAGWKSKSDASRQATVVSHIAAAQQSPALLPKHRTKERTLATTLAEARMHLRFSGRLQERDAEAFAKINSLSSSELDQAFTHAIDQPRTASGEKLLDLILQCWSLTDPQAAVTACAQAFSSDRERFLAQARMPLHHLARQDPTVALDAWRQHWHPLDKDYDNSSEFPLTNVFRSWAQRDLAGALAAYDSTSAELGPAGKYAIEGILAHTVTIPKQREAVLAHLDRTSDNRPDVLHQARQITVNHLARSGQIEEAISWLDSLPVSPSQRQVLEDELAENWFRSDQPAAAAWLMERSDDASRPKRIEELVSDWAEWEPNAAAEWLGTVITQHGNQTDPGIAMFARQVADKDPAGALVWLQAIQNPHLRTQTAERLAKEWARREMHSELHTLLPTAALTEHDSQVIRSLLRR